MKYNFYKIMFKLQNNTGYTSQKQNKRVPFNKLKVQ